GDADEAGAARLLRAQLRVFLRAHAEDGRERGDRLHVVDHRRRAEETRDRREGWLEPRPALTALEAVEQARLLAADVGARAPVDVDVEPMAGAEDALAEDAGLVAVGDGLLENLGLGEELTADVDVGGVHADRPG